MGRFKFEADRPILDCRRQGMQFRAGVDLWLIRRIDGLSGIIFKIAQFVFRRRERFVVDWAKCESEQQRLEKEALKALKGG